VFELKVGGIHLKCKSRPFSIHSAEGTLGKTAYCPTIHNP